MEKEISALKSEVEQNVLQMIERIAKVAGDWPVNDSNTEEPETDPNAK